MTSCWLPRLQIGWRVVVSIWCCLWEKHEFCAVALCLWHLKMFNVFNDNSAVCCLWGFMFDVTVWEHEKHPIMTGYFHEETFIRNTWVFETVTVKYSIEIFLKKQQRTSFLLFFQKKTSPQHLNVNTHVSLFQYKQNTNLTMSSQTNARVVKLTAKIFK